MEKTVKRANFERPTFPLVPVIIAGAFALFVLSWVLLSSHFRFVGYIEDYGITQTRLSALNRIQWFVRHDSLEMRLSDEKESQDWKLEHQNTHDEVIRSGEELLQSFGESEISGPIKAFLKVQNDIEELCQKSLKADTNTMKGFRDIESSPIYQRLEEHRDRLLKEIGVLMAADVEKKEKDRNEAMGQSIAVAILSIFILSCIGIAVAMVTMAWRTTIGNLFDQLEIELDHMTQETTEAIRKQEEAAKLALLGEMVSGISHEIRNPLGIIVGHAEDLLDHINHNQISKESLQMSAEKIVKMSDRIGKIIKGLATLSRNDRNDPLAPTNLLGLINDSIEICSGKIKTYNISIFVDCDPQLMVMGRDAQICQVITNLVNNAIDAVAGKPNPWIRINAKKHDGLVQVQIIDSGHGISADVADRLMQSFYTTKSKGKGTGLGLSICKRIITDHGGDFTIDTRATNTTFQFTLVAHHEGAQKKSA